MVVDTEVVGKKLLERGQLQKRVTFIPLNKISSSCIDQRTIQHAERMVRDPPPPLPRSRGGMTEGPWLTRVVVRESSQYE